MNSIQSCESCGNGIARNGNHPFEIQQTVVTVPTDDPQTYEDRDYILCTECRRRIIDFIEGMDESETRADLVELELAARELSEFADDLDAIATDLGDLSRADTDTTADE